MNRRGAENAENYDNKNNRNYNHNYNYNYNYYGNNEEQKEGSRNSKKEAGDSNNWG